MDYNVVSVDVTSSATVRIEFCLTAVEKNTPDRGDLTKPQPRIGVTWTAGMARRLSHKPGINLHRDARLRMYATHCRRLDS
mgnify:CR=1 FL=1